jgi:membrane fusion protein, heavy metal efflux system
MLDRFLNISITALFIFLASCGKKEESKNEESAVQSSEVTLSAAQVNESGIVIGATEQRKMSVEITANGVIDVPPQYKAVVSVIAGGFVKSTEVLEGDHVHKGDVLAVLTHPDYIKLQQEYLEARSRQSFLEKDFERQKELREENINSKKKLEESEMNLSINLAQLKALGARLKMLGLDPEKVSQGNISSDIKIKAPITGNITLVNSSLGKFIKPEEPVFEVISKEHIHLELKVFESDVLKIKTGQKVLYMLSDNEVRTAEIILVGMKLDDQSRTIPVHAHPKDDANDILPGMYVKAKIQTEEKMVASLPEESIVREGESTFIFIKTGEKVGRIIFKKVPVKTGMVQDSYIEIISGSEEIKNNIVTKGAYFITSEMNKSEPE